MESRTSELEEVRSVAIVESHRTRLSLKFKLHGAVRKNIHPNSLSVWILALVHNRCISNLTTKLF